MALTVAEDKTTSSGGLGRLPMRMSSQIATVDEPTSEPQHETGEGEQASVWYKDSEDKSMCRDS